VCIAAALCWAAKLYSRRVEFSPVRAVFGWIGVVVHAKF